MKKKVLLMVSLLVLALGGTVFATELYEPTGINGIRLSNYVGQTEPSEIIVTENSFFNRESAQLAVCEIVEQKCGEVSVEESDCEAEIQELKNEIETLELRVSELEEYLFGDR